MYTNVYITNCVIPALVLDISLKQFDLVNLKIKSTFVVIDQGIASACENHHKWKKIDGIWAGAVLPACWYSFILLLELEN